MPYAKCLSLNALSPNDLCTVSYRSYKNQMLFAGNCIRMTILNTIVQFIPFSNIKQQKRVTEKFCPVTQSFKTTREAM